MVSNVVVGDVVEEETSYPAEKGAVDGTDCAAEEGPFIFPVVWHCGVSVVEEGEHYNPVIGEQVGNKVDREEVEETSLICPICESTAHSTHRYW